MSTPPTGPEQPDEATREDGAETERLDLTGSTAPEEAETSREPAAHPQAQQPEEGATATAYPFEEPTTVVPAAGPTGPEAAATTVVPAAYPQEMAPEATAPLPAGVRYTPAEPVPGTYWQDADAGSPEVPAVDPLPHLQGEPPVFPEGVFHEPPSRAGAHLWAVLIAVTLSPVAWFLLSDGSTRLYWSLRADPGSPNLAGLFGLAVGLLITAVVLLTGRWSSVGASVAGSVSFLIGLSFAIIPARTLEIIDSWDGFLSNFGGFGANVQAYLVEDGIRGHFLIGGVVLILLAAVSHGARRKGRREEFARLAVRAARGENPWG